MQSGKLVLIGPFALCCLGCMVQNKLPEPRVSVEDKLLQQTPQAQTTTQAVPTAQAQTTAQAEPTAVVPVAATRNSPSNPSSNQKLPESSAPKPRPPASDLGGQPMRASDIDIPVVEPDSLKTAVDRRARTLLQMQKIGLALKEYFHKNRRLPELASCNFDDQPLLSWRVHLLPYLGHQELYERFRLDEPWNSANNQRLLDQIPPVYQSPERFDDRTNYLVPLSPVSIFPGLSFCAPNASFEAIERSALLVEVDDQYAVPWSKPDEYLYRTINASDPWVGLGHLREDGFFVLFGPSNLRRIPHTVGAPTLSRVLADEPIKDVDIEKISKEAIAEPDVKPNQAVAVRSQTRNSADASLPGYASIGPHELAHSSPRSRWEANALGKAAFDAQRLGREKDALLYYHALKLVTDETDAFAPELRWVAALKRPAMAIRWGVGVRYSAPRGHELSSDPIRASAATTVQPKSPSQKAFLDLTGELGDRLLGDLQFRVDEGYCGDLLRSATAEPTIDQPFDASPPPIANVNVPTLLSPGVTYLGQGSNRVLLHLARREQVDVLIEFDLDVKILRRTVVHNTTTINVYDVVGDRKLFSSAPLNNLRVRTLRQDPLQDDPVAPVLNKLLTFLAENFSMSDLPNGLKQEHASRRVAALAAAKHDNPLPVLTEIRLYHDRHLISENEAVSAYEAILGEGQGTILAKGSTLERQTALARWLPIPGRRVSR